MRQGWLVEGWIAAAQEKIDIYEKAAKAVEVLIDKWSSPAETQLIKTCALAIRGLSLEECTKMGPIAVETYKKAYGMIGCDDQCCDPSTLTIAEDHDDDN